MGFRLLLTFARHQKIVGAHQDPVRSPLCEHYRTGVQYRPDDSMTTYIAPSSESQSTNAQSREEKLEDVDVILIRLGHGCTGLPRVSVGAPTRSSVLGTLQLELLDRQQVFWKFVGSGSGPVVHINERFCENQRPTRETESRSPDCRCPEKRESSPVDRVRCVNPEASVKEAQGTRAR